MTTSLLWLFSRLWLFSILWLFSLLWLILPLIMVIMVIRVTSVKSLIGILTHQGHISKVNTNAEWLSKWVSKWVSEWVTLITSRASCDANNIFQRSDYVPSFAWANFIVGQAWSNSDTRQKRDALQSSNYVSNLILEMIKLWRNWLLFSGQQKTNQNSFQGLLDRLIKQNRRWLPRMNFCLSAKCKLQCSFEHISALRNSPAKIEYREKILRGNVPWQN